MGGHSTTLSLPACPHPAQFWSSRAVCDPSSAAAGALTSPHPAPGGCSHATGPFSTLYTAQTYFLYISGFVPFWLISPWLFPPAPGEPSRTFCCRQLTCFVHCLWGLQAVLAQPLHLPHGKSIPNEQILHCLAVPRGSCSTEAGTTCPSCFPRFPMARVQQHLADVTFLMGEQGQGQPLGFCGVPSWPPLWVQSCNVPCMSRKRTSCSQSPWHGSGICSPSAALA